MKHTLILSFVFLISLFFNLTAFLFASYPAAYAATHIQAADSPADPLLAVCSSQENPAAFNTFITWRKLDGAVSYELELWTPVKGEWCWFWDKCTPHRPTLRQYDIFPEGYSEENMFHDSEQNPFDFCEPFLNSRPSYLKDK